MTPALAASLALAWEMRASSTAVVGEPVAVTGVLRSKSSADLVLELAAPATAPYAVTAARSEPGKVEGGLRSQAFRVEVLPLAGGDLALATRWRLPGEKEATVESPPVIVKVSEPALASDQLQIRDIKPPRRAWPALWPWLLAAAAAAGVWRWRGRGRLLAAGVAGGPEVPFVPPADEARAALAALAASGLWAAGRHKEYYAGLTHVLRRYLERRYDFPATFMTSAEVLRHLRELELSRASGLAVKGALERADLVKFAKAEPEPDWGARDLEAVGRLVEETAPAPAARAEVGA